MYRHSKLFTYLNILVVVFVLYLVKVLRTFKDPGETSVVDGGRDREPLVDRQKLGISKRKRST